MLKKSVDILNLPVISIREGKKLGIVKQYVINPTKGCVTALAIDDGKWYYGAKLLPFTAITGIGECAITIETSEDIVTLIQAPEFEELLCADITVINSKVFTKAGRSLGNVTEIIVDNSGKIAICEITDCNNEVSHIKAQRILTFGKEVLIVADDTETTAEPKATKPSTALPTNTPLTSDNKPIDIESNHEVITDNFTPVFEEKDRKYLLGKKANRRIETNTGVLIVEDGGDITEAILQKAKLAGKFEELAANIQNG